MHPSVHSSITYDSQNMETPKCPLADEWMRKIWYIFTMDYYLAIKRIKSCHLQQYKWT